MMMFNGTDHTRQKIAGIILFYGNAGVPSFLSRNDLSLAEYLSETMKAMDGRKVSCGPPTEGKNLQVEKVVLTRSTTDNACSSATPIIARLIVLKCLRITNWVWEEPRRQEISSYPLRSSSAHAQLFCTSSVVELGGSLLESRLGSLIQIGLCVCVWVWVCVCVSKSCLFLQKNPSKSAKMDKNRKFQNHRWTCIFWVWPRSGRKHSILAYFALAWSMGINCLTVAKVSILFASNCHSRRK